MIIPAKKFLKKYVSAVTEKLVFINIKIDKKETLKSQTKLLLFGGLL